MTNHDNQLTTSERHQQNRAAWNEAASQYEADLEERIAFLKAGGGNLMAPEMPYLQDLDKWCNRAIHLQCAGGTDTLSLWNHGAKEVVGIDISERMIAVARRKSEAIRANAHWHCCDLLETPEELYSTADLVYTGRGALCWVMDIEAWAQIVAKLLKPGGKLYVFEGHPLDWVWDPKSDVLKLDEDEPFGNYFSHSIAKDSGWPELYIPTELVPDVSKQEHKFERQWTLGQIMNSLIAAGLRLVRFEEHPDQYWEGLPNLPVEIANRLPHTFSLFMSRPM